MKSAASRANGRVFLPVLFFILPVIILISSCGREQPSSPKLAILIVVDQMRADYFQRFAGYFSGGLARLQKQGAVFLNAHHRHANTETAPGHASLSTGSNPAHHGIVSNYWFDATAGKRVYAVADSQVKTFDSNDHDGRSPHLLMRPALGDWLKKQHPDAKVISISRKDRAAILLGGSQPDAAYWYNSRNGGFTSSSYYLEQLPPWVTSWNEQRHAGKFWGRVWEKIRPAEEYLASREDLFDGEEGGKHSAFPHAFGNDETQPNEAFYGWLMDTPFTDELTLAFAAVALRAEQLGGDGAPDLLCISLSSTDAVGHGYGPLSQEMQDNLMRLDQKLGEFFAEVDQQVGLENCVIGLSSDHGVLPLPEELRRRGFESARIPSEEIFAEVGGVLAEMRQELHSRRPLLKSYYDEFYLDYTAADSAGISREDFEQRMAAKLKTLSVVAETYTPAFFAAGDSGASEIIQRFRNNVYPGRSPSLFAQFKPYYLIGAGKTGTGHGSVYDYDSRVPMVFMGKGAIARQDTTSCATTDFAPTIAAMMGIAIPKEIDGRVLEFKSK